MGLTRESFAEEVRLERIRQASWAAGWLFRRGRVRLVPGFAGCVCVGTVLRRGAKRNRTGGSERAHCAAPPLTLRPAPSPHSPPKTQPKVHTRGAGKRGGVAFSLQPPLEAQDLSSFLGL